MSRTKSKTLALPLQDLPQTNGQRDGHGFAHALRNRVAPLVLLALGAFGMFGSVQLSLGEASNPGPGLWPFIVAATLVVTSGIIIATRDVTGNEPWGWRAFGIIGGLIGLGVFILLFQSVGFLIPAFLMAVLWLRTFGKESWRLAILLAVVGTGVMYVLFVVVLAVPFPEDIVVTSVSSWIGV